MTGIENPEEEIEAIDAEIDELSSRNSGFDFAAEIRRLRTVFAGERRSADRTDRQFASKRERIERIRELQRQRERILEKLADRQRDTRTEQKRGGCSENRHD